LAGFDVVAQVVGQVAAGASDLGEDHPAAEQAERAAGVEPGLQADPGAALVERSDGPGVRAVVTNAGMPLAS
jgi:hypothetical protein